MTNQQLWQALLGNLEISLSKANFTTWFKNTFIAEIDDRRIIVGVPNGFTKAWLETKYHPSILKALQNTASTEIAGVEYRVESRRDGVAPTGAILGLRSRAVSGPAPRPRSCAGLAGGPSGPGRFVVAAHRRRPERRAADRGDGAGAPGAPPGCRR